MSVRESAAIRVLLVSNDPPVVELLGHITEQMGIHSEVCADLQTARRHLCAHKYEGIVVDLAMGESSLELLKSLPDFTSNKGAVSCAILGDPHQKAFAFQAGANFILERPLEHQTALRTLRAGYPMMIRERRRYFRCPVETPTFVTIEPHPGFQATSVNISEGGMALLSPVEIKIGQHLQMRLRVPGKSHFIDINGEVCWTDGSGRIGIQFTEISASVSEALESWLLQRLEEMMAARNL